MEDDFEDAARYLEKRDRAKPKVQSSARVIYDYAKVHGLSSQNILRVTKLCTDDSLKPVSARKILTSALIPVDYIPEEAAVCVILKVCSGRCSSVIAKTLLKWLELKFDSIRSTSDLQSLTPLMLYFAESEMFSQLILRLMTLILCDRRGALDTVRAEGLKRFHLFRHRRRSKLTIESAKIFSDEFLDILTKQNSRFDELELKNMEYRSTHVVALSPLNFTVPHLQLFLHYHLSTTFIENSEKAEDFSEAMHGFFFLNDLLQNTNQVWMSFITDFMATWNLTDKCDTILKILSNLPITSFPSLQPHILAGLKKAVLFSPDVNLKCEILDALQNLVVKYIISAARSSRLVEVENYKLAISEILKFVEDVVLDSTLLDHNALVLIHALMDFWDTASMALQKYEICVEYTPHPYFVARALFGLSSSSLASVCKTLSCLCQNPSVRGTEFFNNLLENGSNICNVLCHNYPGDQDFSSLQEWKNDYLGLKPNLSNRQQMGMFAFDKHPAFSVSITKIRARKAGNFYLTEFLNSLDDDGLVGISKFVHDFVDIP